MTPLNRYIILKEIKEDVKQTQGGLLLAEKHREDVRYRKGEIVDVAASIEAVAPGNIVWYDRSAGHNIEFKTGELRRVIRDTDIVIVE